MIALVVADPVSKVRLSPCDTHQLGQRAQPERPWAPKELRAKCFKFIDAGGIRRPVSLVAQTVKTGQLPSRHPLPVCHSSRALRFLMRCIPDQCWGALGARGLCARARATARARRTHELRRIHHFAIYIADVLYSREKFSEKRERTVRSCCILCSSSLAASNARRV
eukprot:COSAG03_NODE_269_length_9603_cov_225.864927_3_plen_166_part_00